MQFANDVLGLDLIARSVEAQRLFALPTTQLVPPARSLGDAANNLTMVASRNFGAQGSERLTRICDQRKIRRSILAHVRRIDIDVDDSRVRCKCRQLPRYP